MLGTSKTARGPSIINQTFLISIWPCWIAEHSWQIPFAKNSKILFEQNSIFEEYTFYTLTVNDVHMHTQHIRIRLISFPDWDSQFVPSKGCDILDNDRPMMSRLIQFRCISRRLYFRFLEILNFWAP